MGIVDFLAVKLFGPPKVACALATTKSISLAMRSTLFRGDLAAWSVIWFRAAEDWKELACRGARLALVYGALCLVFLLLGWYIVSVFVSVVGFYIYLTSVYASLCADSCFRLSKDLRLISLNPEAAGELLGIEIAEK